MDLSRQIQGQIQDDKIETRWRKVKAIYRRDHRFKVKYQIRLIRKI